MRIKALATLKQIWQLIKETFHEFSEDNVMHYGASLSYYTIFALPPIITVVITAAGVLFGKEAVSGQIYLQLAGLLGSQGALEVQNMVEVASKLRPNFFAKVIGIVAIIFSSTGVFLSIQDTLNTIWKVKAKPKSNFLKLVRDRTLSFAMVMVIAFLLLVSLVIHAAAMAVSQFMERYLGSVTVLMINLFNFFIPFAVIALLFAMIFKFLPDAKVRWKDVWVGAVVTSLLFSLGKFIIGFYLGTSNVSSAYGAAGTVIIILLWVFYSSILLFLGAEFTKVYALKHGKAIEPMEYAVRFEKVIIDKKEPAAK